MENARELPWTILVNKLIGRAVVQANKRALLERVGSELETQLV